MGRPRALQNPALDLRERIDHRRATERSRAQAGLMVEMFGIERTAKMLGISRESLLRVLAGLDVRRGTLVLFEHAIAAHERREAAALAEVDAEIAKAVRR